jgi:hypothetical protein
MQKKKLNLAMESVIYQVPGDVVHGKKALGVVALVAAIAIPIAAPAMVSSLATSGALGATMSAALTTTAGSVIGSALTSAALSAATAKLTGGDASDAALMGALSGGLSGYGFAQTDAFTNASNTVAANNAGAQVAAQSAAGQGAYAVDALSGLGGEAFLDPAAAQQATAATYASYGATAPAGLAAGTSAGLSAPGATVQAATPTAAAAPTPTAAAAPTAPAQLSVGQRVYQGVNTALGSANTAGLSASLDPNVQEQERLLRDQEARATEARRMADVARQQEQDLYQRKLSASDTLMSQARAFDPEYYARLRSNQAQVTSASALRSAMESSSMRDPRAQDAREAEERRYQLSAGLQRGTAYNQGMVTGLQGQQSSIQNALTALPSGAPSSGSSTEEEELRRRQKELDSMYASATTGAAYLQGTQSVV